jgi:hypothetical protein
VNINEHNKPQHTTAHNRTSNKAETMNAPPPPPMPEAIVYEKVQAPNLSPHDLKSLVVMTLHAILCCAVEWGVVGHNAQTEYEDPPEKRAQKIRQLVDIVRNAKNLVVYTGAGVRFAHCLLHSRVADLLMQSS